MTTVVAAERKPPPTAIAVRRTDAPPSIGVPLVLDDTARRLLAGWLEGKSEDTKRSYFASARHFAGWLVELGHAKDMGPPWKTIAIGLRVPKIEGNLRVQEWIRSQAGMSKGGIATRCSGVRTLCEMLETLGLLEYVPRFKRPRSPRLSARERAQKYKGVAAAFDAIMSGLDRRVAAPRPSVIDVRDWAIVRQGSMMGLRRVELVRIELADLDFDAGSIAIRGKGRDRKELLRMPPALAPVLRRWLRARAGVVRPGCQALYVTLGRGGGRPIADRGLINEMLVRRAEQFGVQLAPHDLRRIMCTEALRLYGAEKATQITRHASVSTVLLYDLEQGEQADAMADEVGAAIAKRGKPPKGRKR